MTGPSHSEVNFAVDARVSKGPQRRAAARWIKLIFRGVELLGKQGFVDFRNVSRLEATGMMQGVGSGVFTDASIAAFSQLPCPPLLSICSDQESVQISGSCFMAAELKLATVYFRDFFHRLHNDSNMAVALAGLMPAFFAGMAIMSLGYGPWQTCVWWHGMVVEAKNLAVKSSANSPLLLKAWRRIVGERGL